MYLWHHIDEQSEYQGWFVSSSPGDLSELLFATKSSINEFCISNLEILEFVGSADTQWTDTPLKFDCVTAESVDSCDQLTFSGVDNVSEDLIFTKTDKDRYLEKERGQNWPLKLISL